MIKALRANRSSFHNVDFRPGLNVILADRTKAETKKNSRNGLGKSTLIELLHFCLGGAYKGPITAPELRGWVFTIELDLGGLEIVASRDTSSPGVITVETVPASRPVQQPKENTEIGAQELPVRIWHERLGHSLFGLPIGATGKFRPTFRGLISYFVRRGREAYINPFEYFSKQKPVQRQTLVAYLLGLEFQDAIDFQELKDRNGALRQLRKLTSGADTARELLGSLGELEAKKVRLESQVRREEDELRSFRVHPQYEQISHQANTLTEEIHRLTNENVVERRLLELYQQSLKEEKPPRNDDVVQLYERVGIELPGVAKKRLDDVQRFHSALIQNRRSFLTEERQRLEQSTAIRVSHIETASSERAELMSVLQTHGALDEFTKLQQKHLKTRADLEATQRQIKNIQDLRQGESSVKIERELLVSRALRGLGERAANRDRAIELFNSNSQALYEQPGNLLVDVGEAGFEFDVAIERSTSGGVENMKIFCFDLALAQSWAGRSSSPGFLIHDSNIFDGVDERQRALALELAARESEKFGFQYICTLNSDAVPWNEFSRDFHFKEHVRVTLSDQDERSRLTGIRFETGASEEEGEDATDEDKPNASE